MKRISPVDICSQKKLHCTEPGANKETIEYYRKKENEDKEDSLDLGTAWGFF